MSPYRTRFLRGILIAAGREHLSSTTLKWIQPFQNMVSIPKKMVAI
jgi:hypothetical protein